MIMLFRYILAVALGWVFLTGCAHMRPDGAELSTSEVIRIAKEAPKREGISLSHYKRPKARYRDDRWWVFFDRRGLLRKVGSFFAVDLDDRT